MASASGRNCRQGGKSCRPIDEPARRPALPATPSVPSHVEGVDVNHCKNPNCSAFGEPVAANVTRGPGAINSHTVVATDKGQPAIRCNCCGYIYPMKSNFGVVEELRRMEAVFHPADDLLPRTVLRQPWRSTASASRTRTLILLLASLKLPAASSCCPAGFNSTSCLSVPTRMVSLTLDFETSTGLP